MQACRLYVGLHGLTHNAAATLFGFLGVLLAAPLTVVICVCTLLGENIKVAGNA